MRTLVSLRLINRRLRERLNSKVFYTYLIKSKIKNWRYIGSTRDLEKRFKNHNQGKVRSTKKFLPFELVYYEAFKTYHLARKREIELKTKGQQKEILFDRLGLR